MQKCQQIGLTLLGSAFGKPLINLGGFSNSLNWTKVPLKPSTTMRYMLAQPSPPGGC